jgi:hypothetical protein
VADRRFAFALFIVALVAGVTGPRVLPQGLVWITVAVLFWAAGTIWYRTVDWSARRAQDAPTALLTRAPDLPAAAALCAQLRENGVEAFWIGEEDDGSAQVWVAESDLLRAQALLEDEEVSDAGGV